MAYDNDNIFAKILRGEADAHIVLEEEHCVAFMDAMPQSAGHTLVIPRQPAENVFELSRDALTHLIATTQRVARAVQAAFKPAGLMLMQLNGSAAGQTVFHVHFHVVPRYTGDGMTMHARAAAPSSVLKEHAVRVRAALDHQRDES